MTGTNRPVDHQVSTQRARQFAVAACHDRDNLGAAILGQLKRGRSDRAGGAVNQDPVAGSQSEMFDGPKLALRMIQ